MKQCDLAAAMAEARQDLAYLTDMATHRIIYMSQAAMDISGYSTPEEYQHELCCQVVPCADAPCASCPTPCHPGCQGSNRPQEVYHAASGRWLRLDRRTILISGRECCAHWATDITQEHSQIETLQSDLQLEAAAAACGRILCLEADVGTAMKLFLASIGAYYHSDRASVFEIDQEHLSVSNTYEWCADGVDSQMEFVRDFPLSEELLSGSRSLHPDAANLFSRETQVDAFATFLLNHREIRQTLVVPLMKNGTLTGYLSVDNPRSHFSNDTLLRRAADLLTEDFQRRQVLCELQNQEYSDRLTGLQNRSRYLQTVELYHKLPPSSLAVFILDLNGLKELNEHSGHDAGDRFICRCADILREMDLNVFRINGDEFIVLQPGIDQNECLHMEEQLRTGLEALHPYSVSLGCAWCGSEVDVLSLVTQADQNMYAEKQIYYRSALSQERPIRVGMATEVLEEIKHHHFLVYFQPQVDLSTGALYGAEALVRKTDADGHLIFPDHFVPFYETEGVISHMDFHVLELVCDQMIQWAQTLDQYPKISVNFSRQTLMEPDVVERITRICAKWQVSPSQITIEVTESAGRLSQQQLSLLIQGFRDAGFSVALDDFGSHYSNLSILTDIDFQLIKLDKSLIDQVGLLEKGTNVAKSLISLCRDTLTTPTLAEGVETLAQLEMLRSFSCDYAQGYYFSRPISAAAFTELLQSRIRYPL